MMKHSLPFLFTVILIVSIFLGCSSSDEDDVDWSLANSDVALLSFKMRDTDTLFDRSNVFFTIDLVSGQVYNADSLPYGYKIDTISVTMDFNYPSAVYLMNEKDTIDYLTNPTDSISFENGVRLKVVSRDKKIERIYNLKLNVHQLKTDSLQWLSLDQATLPTTSPLIGQKTVQIASHLYLFMQDASGYTRVSPDGSSWGSPQSVPFPAAADLRSLSVLGAELYVNTAGGTLYRSSDLGSNWQQIDLGETITALIGVWTGKTESRLLGISKVAGDYYRFTYNGTNYVRESQPVESYFPISGFSNTIQFTQGIPQLSFACGELQNGSLSTGVWGYDGTRWIALNNIGEFGSVVQPFSAREGAQFVPYFNETISLPLWILFGGKDSNGSYLRDIYYSMDLGINWFEAGESLQLPAALPSMAYASLFVLTHSPFEDAIWAPLALPAGDYRALARNAALLEDAPYIYLFGGEGRASGNTTIFDQVWRGVINQLRFPEIE